MKALYLTPCRESSTILKTLAQFRNQSVKIKSEKPSKKKEKNPAKNEIILMARLLRRICFSRWNNWILFIKTARKPQAFKPGDEWLPGGPTVFVGPQARNYGVLWSRN
jgi:hypothetical protein